MEMYIVVKNTEHSKEGISCFSTKRVADKQCAKLNKESCAFDMVYYEVIKKKITL